MATKYTEINVPAKSYEDPRGVVVSRRYTIHAIADANMTSVHPEELAATDDGAEARRLAEQHSNSLFGAAIVDNETGKIYYGIDKDDE